jgi:hypothetical protein
MNISIEKIESTTGAQGLGKRKKGQVKTLRSILTKPSLAFIFTELQVIKLQWGSTWPPMPERKKVHAKKELCTATCIF